MRFFSLAKMALFVLASILFVLPLSCGDDDSSSEASAKEEDDDFNDNIDDDANDDDLNDDDDDLNDDDDVDDDDVCQGCLIDTICYEDQETKPSDLCKACIVAQSTNSWSDNNGALCNDGIFCNGADVCHAGECSVHPGNPCPMDDGLWCNGEETDECDEEAHECGHTGNPCEPEAETCEEGGDYCRPSCIGVQIDNGELDQDNDGDQYTEDTGDCNDADNAVNPDAQEVFDGVDNNCDGMIDEGFDEDCDGFLAENIGGDDCNDNDYRVNPGVADDGLIFIDYNCDGVIGDAASGDADGDGFAALGTSGGILDCDENSVLINPSAQELPNDSIDQNCDGADLVPSNENGVFVSTTGDDLNPGSMAAPKLTINAAVDLALQEGKSVFVAQGDYREDVETIVPLFGGYESIEWTRDFESRITSIISATSVAVVIGNWNPWLNNDYEEAYWDATSIDDATLVVIQGFSIYGRGTSRNTGTGVRNGYDAVSMLTDNRIVAGGVYGGIGIDNGGTALLVNNEIISDGCFEEGYCFGGYNAGNIILVNNIIRGAIGDAYESTGFCNSGTAMLISNTIYGGSGNRLSCGVLNRSDSHPESCLTLINNIIDSGYGGDESYGVYNDGGSGSIRLVNNDIWGEHQDYLLRAGSIYLTQITALNNCAWPGCTEASDNISADSLIPGWWYDDFHLPENSPCIDAGIDPIPTYIPLGFAEFDFEGDARPYGTAWDIGPDEWTPAQ